jgi:hypothetical protein
MNPNDTFDELYKNHQEFLEAYVKRDTRYINE